jgi:hypothetical protein
LEKIKNKNINKLLLEKKYINVKNLPIKPIKGGIPANDKNSITTYKYKKGKLPKNFNSFKVLKYFISKIKKIKNRLININI